jgi:hypothetical protein
LQDELETVKKERDSKLQEYQQKLEKEREVWQQKKRDLDSKNTTKEQKHTELLLYHEKEKAKWD